MITFDYLAICLIFIECLEISHLSSYGRCLGVFSLCLDVVLKNAKVWVGIQFSNYKETIWIRSL